jgi:ABC-2 type transport system ATP-binding protein
LSADQPIPVLEVNGLSKRYKGTRTPAVNNLNFTVAKGEIFGFLGPNGAGKTTTISIMSTLMKPSGGQVKICGIDIKKKPGEARKLISLVPQEIALYHELTGKENLNYFGSMYGLDRKRLQQKISTVLETFEIRAYADRRISRCSGGIKRRFNIACGILHDPALIFMDEPTVGMDVHSRNTLLVQIRSLSEMGSTIVYTTHYMEEAQKICSRVLIMNHGIPLAQGTPGDLVQNEPSCNTLGDLFLSITGKRLGD